MSKLIERIENVFGPSENSKKGNELKYKQYGNHPPVDYGVPRYSIVIINGVKIPCVEAIRFQSNGDVALITDSEVYPSIPLHWIKKFVLYIVKDMECVEENLTECAECGVCEGDDIIILMDYK